MNFDVRAVQSAQATEYYITAVPAGRQGPELFEAIAAVLQDKKACIILERVFAPREQIAALRQARSTAYRELADGVEPTFLAAEDAPGVMPGVQMHAMAGGPTPRVISVGDARARMFEFDGLRYVIAPGLRAPEAGDESAQARATFEKAEGLLRLAGGDLRNVARTWVFMDDVLSWYGRFNQARSGFFRERGLLGPGAAGLLPASTGIGVSPADGSRCAIDFFAVVGSNGCVKRHEAAGRQRSANEYGSAFARAATAVTPGGKTVFISGTAAIDPAGTTCFKDDAAGQIQMTLDCVTAVLSQLSVSGGEVVQAMAYCASPRVRELFLARYAAALPWPWLTMIGDVCRDDLLFEVEAAACPGAKRL